MKIRILLLVLLLSFSVSGYATIWVITNSGDTFSPSSITINQGDSVRFTLESHHNAMQVSMANWNANGNSLLSGGFQTNFGGGLILPSQLSSGTNYYVCTPHASSGMKGTIVVQVTTDIAEKFFIPEISVYPNPSQGKFRLELNNFQSSHRSSLEVYTLHGEKLYVFEIKNSISEIDLSNRASGIYLLKIFDGQKVFAEKKLLKW